MFLWYLASIFAQTEPKDRLKVYLFICSLYQPGHLCVQTDYPLMLRDISNVVILEMLLFSLPTKA